MSLSSSDESSSEAVATITPTSTTIGTEQQTPSKVLHHEYKLYREIERLTMELQMQDAQHRAANESYLQRIAALENAQQKSTSELESFKEIVSKSKLGTMDLEQKLQEARTESDMMRAQMETESTQHAASRRKIQNLEEELSRKVDELAKVQTAQDEKSRQLLIQARSQLQRVQQERDSMVRHLLQVSGQAPNEVSGSLVGSARRL